jgi:hypothetical protein
MSETSQPRDTMKLFEQHWTHARHLENERLTFTSVFAGVVGGTLAYVRDHFAALETRPLLFLLLVFSIFGLLFCMKVTSLFETHKQLADMLLDHDQFVPEVATKHWSDQVFSISRIFLGFYALCFSLITFLLLRSFAWTATSSELGACATFLCLAVFVWLVARLKKGYLARVLCPSPRSKSSGKGAGVSAAG